MNIIEDEYKNRFKDQGSIEGIDVNDLWQGISEELDDTTDKPLTGIWRNIKRALLALLFIFIGAFSLYYFQTEHIIDSKDVEKNSFPKVSEELSSSNVATNQDVTGNEMPQPEDIKTSTTPNESIISKNKGSKKEQDIVLKENPKDNTSNKDKSESLLSTEVNPNSSVSKSGTRQFSKDQANNSKILSTINKQSPNSENLKIDASNINDDQKIVEPSTLSDHHTPNNNAEISTHSIALTATPLLATIAFSTLATEPKLLHDLSLAPLTPPNIHNSNSFQIAVLSGANIMFPGYRKNNDNDLSNVLKNTTSSMSGLSTSIRFSWQKQGKFSLSTGVNYETIRIKFSTVKETTTTVLIENYLTNFELDSQTGDTINQTFESKMQDAIAKRTVLHHNNFRLIAIPLEIGIQRQKGKFVYGLNLGIGANFFISQKGKTINQQGLIHIIDDSISDELPFKKFFLSYHVNPFVDYSLSSNLKLRFSPVLKYQVHGTSALYDLKQYSIYTGMNLGVVFKL